MLFHLSYPHKRTRVSWRMRGDFKNLGNQGRIWKTKDEIPARDENPTDMSASIEQAKIERGFFPRQPKLTKLAISLFFVQVIYTESGVSKAGAIVSTFDDG